MANEEAVLREVKTRQIEREYTGAQSVVARCADRINTIRTWNITVIVAYWGWLTTQTESHHSGPLIAAVSLFWFLEALERMSVHLTREYRVAKVDELFSKKKLAAFYAAVDDFEFATQVHEEGLSRLKKKWPRFVRGMFSLHTVVIYLLPLLLIAYCDPAISRHLECLWILAPAAFLVWGTWGRRG